MPGRTELMRQFVPASPLVGRLGIRLERVGDDEAELCFCEIDVTDAAGQPVAKGLMTHRYG